MGVELAAEEKIKEAADEFLAVVRLNPDYALAHFNLGNAYARAGMLEQARLAFAEAQRLDPTNAAAAERRKVVDDLLRKRETP